MPESRSSDNELSFPPRSLSRIIDAVNQHPDPDSSCAREIVEVANVSADDLAGWTLFNYPTTDSYGRCLIHDGGFFELMAMCWRAGDYSAIHDHGHTQWGAVQIFGPAEHAVFHVDTDGIRTASIERITPGQVLPVNGQLVHQMGNPEESVTFVSLHLYGNVERATDITADARVFNLARNRIERTDGGVFYDLPQTAIKDCEPSPKPDQATWRRDVELHADRLRRANKPTAWIDSLLGNESV
ncbi:MAG: hypothetical protein DHS20C01_09700 [marine bacterium B5-7]|nr:MAG: hypothetical protein DHS20C01_09700 [marine bacterium B5-7]